MDIAKGACFLLWVVDPSVEGFQCRVPALECTSALRVQMPFQPPLVGSLLLSRMWYSRSIFTG
jgi:hypothetical protein